MTGDVLGVGYEAHEHSNKVLMWIAARRGKLLG
jgi:hypothetical protein